MFNKGPKAIQYRKDGLFNKWCWNSWISICNKCLNIDIHVILFTKINSKWVIDLNIKFNTTNTREGKDLQQQSQNN